MGIPVVQTYRIARYILEQKLKGNKRYPLVLMLEPLFQCNLACSGCGKIDYPDEILRKRMSVEDALNAVDAAFKLQAAVRALALHFKRDLLEAADAGIALVNYFHFPAAILRVVAVQAE